MTAIIGTAMEEDNKELGSNTSLVIEEALKYLSLGFSVIPLGSITKDSYGKKVIEYPKDGWKKYQSTRSTVEEVDSWNCKNLGIVTGQISGLLVLDTDSYKEGFNKELLKSFNLPITPVQETASKGKQYFFRLPKGVLLNNAVCIGTKDSGIDIRGDGGMVIAPPSTTPYGEYKWIIDPIDTPLADIPSGLLDLIKDDSRGESGPKKTLPELVGLKDGEGRNNAMASFVGKLLLTVREENWDKEVWPMAQTVNQTYKPPLPESELKSVYESITKMERERKPNLGTGDIKNREDHSASDTEVKSSLREFLKKDKKEGPWEIAKYLIKKYHIKTIGNKDNTKEIYLYSEGLYAIDKGFLKKEIIDIIENIGGSHVREEVLKIIKEKTYRKREDFEVDRNYINLKNGIYDIESNRLLPHDPEFLFLHQIPVVYDVNADCPKIKHFLNQILDEESINVIQEWFGYCLYRSYFIKKAIIFFGGKDTGKTTNIKLLTRFIGSANTTGISLQKIGKDKFATADLHNKHANIYDDLSADDINDNGIFKILTGGGNVTGEKKFGDLFQFSNYAKLAFACNKIPNIKDTDDDAYFSRWILIRFEHVSNKPDKFLFDKISTEEEMSGLFNFALEGLFRLFENQDFSFRQTPEEIKKEMCSSSSSLAEFSYTQLEKSSDPGDYITKDEMHLAFVDYVNKNNRSTISKEMLGKKLPKYISVSDGKRSIRDSDTGKMVQVSCWIGVKFKDPNIQLVRPQPPTETELMDEVTSFFEKEETITDRLPGEEW
jgi:P4 family phage/plasmid primase-like protien